MITMTNEKREFLDWLEAQNGYRVSEEEVEEKFDIEFNLVGITTTRKDGETMVPKRDYRQALKYGQVFD